MKLTTSIYRITDMGNKVKLKQIIGAVYTNPMYIISGIINMSNLVSYVDMVNDNDAIAALKYTYKGISGSIIPSIDGSTNLYIVCTELPSSPNPDIPL